MSSAVNYLKNILNEEQYFKTYKYEGYFEKKENAVYVLKNFERKNDFIGGKVYPPSENRKNWKTLVFLKYTNRRPDNTVLVNLPISKKKELGIN